MKCHKCNQDSIKVANGSIICDICGLDIDVSMLDDPLFDLFIYNEELTEAHKLGRSDYLEGVEKNPYITNADQIAMYSSWDDGNQFEGMVFENSGLSFLAEKYKEEMEKVMEDREFWRTLYVSLKMQVLILFRRKYWFGMKYDKDLSIIIDEHK